MHTGLTILIGAILAGQYVCNAQPWQGYALWNPKEGTTAETFAVIYQGREYHPPLRVNEVSERINRSSAEALLKSLLYAVDRQDPGVYSKLYLPGEKLGQFSPDPSNGGSSLLLRRIMEFNDHSILLVEITNAVRHFPLLFCMKNLGNEFYATTALRTNRAFALLNYFYAFTPLLGFPMEAAVPEPIFRGEGYIYLTNYVADQTVGPPIIFRFAGQKFEANTLVQGCPAPSQQNLHSPTGTLSAAIGALQTRDVEWYSRLLHPEEKTNRVVYGMENAAKGRVWVEWMRYTFARAASARVPKIVHLDGEVRYGDCAILIFGDASSERVKAAGWICLRKSGPEWFISDELNRSANPLVNYLGFAKQLQTKLYPTIAY